MTTDLDAGDPGMEDSCAETVRVRVLPESALQQRADCEAPVRSFDPYSSDIGALGTEPRTRRTLDDMRQLSEAIVRGRLHLK
jgi:hypothetical protein